MIIFCRFMALPLSTTKSRNDYETQHTDIREAEVAVDRRLFKKNQIFELIVHLAKYLAHLKPCRIILYALICVFCAFSKAGTNI